MSRDVDSKLVELYISKDVHAGCHTDPPLGWVPSSPKLREAPGRQVVRGRVGRREAAMAATLILHWSCDTLGHTDWELLHSTLHENLRDRQREEDRQRDS